MLNTSKHFAATEDVPSQELSAARMEQLSAFSGSMAEVEVGVECMQDGLQVLNLFPLQLRSLHAKHHITSPRRMDQSQYSLGYAHLPHQP